MSFVFPQELEMLPKKTQQRYQESMLTSIDPEEQDADGWLGSLAAEVVKYGWEVGIPGPADTRIRRLGTNRKTGQRVGLIGEDTIVPIKRTGTHKDGYRVAELETGEILQIDTEQDPPSVAGYVADATSRSLGILFGLGNAPIAGMSGFIKGAAGGAKEGEASAAEQGYMLPGQIAIGAGAGLIEGLKQGATSALKSIFKRGEFGTRFTEAVKAVTGKDIREHLLAGAEMYPERFGLKRAAKTASELSAPTIEMLIEMALDPFAGPAIYANHVRKLVRGWKFGGEEIQKIGEQAKIAQELTKKIKEPGGMEDVTNLTQMLKPKYMPAVGETRDALAKQVFEEVKRVHGKAPAPETSRFDAIERGIERARGFRERSAKLEAEELRDTYDRAMERLRAKDTRPQEVKDNVLAELSALAYKDPAYVDISKSVYEILTKGKSPYTRLIQHAKSIGTTFHVMPGRATKYPERFFMGTPSDTSAATFMWNQGENPSIYIWTESLSDAMANPQYTLSAEESIAHECMHGLYYDALGAVQGKGKVDFRLSDRADAGMKALVEHIIREAPGVFPELLDYDGKKLSSLPFELREFVSSVMEMQRVGQEVPTHSLTRPGVAYILSKIPGMSSEAASSVTAWDELRDIIVKTIGTKFHDVSLLDDIADILNIVVPQESLERFKDVPLPKLVTDPADYMGGLTFESTGLKGAFDLIGEGARRAWTKLKGIKGEPMPDTMAEAQDVFDDVENMIKGLYKDQGYLRKSDSIYIKQEAIRQGWAMRKGKAGSNTIKLVGEDGTEKIFEGKTAKERLDKVTRFLGHEQTASEFAEGIYSTELGIASQEGVGDFIRWAFPEGIYNVTPEAAWRARNRFKKQLGKYRKSQRFGDESVKQARTVFYRSPSGKAFFDTVLLARDKGEQRFGANFNAFQDSLLRHGIKNESGKIIDPEAYKQARLYVDGFEDKVTNQKAIAAGSDTRELLDLEYLEAKTVGVRKLKPYKPGYFPHHVPPLAELKKASVKEKLIAAAMEEGRFDTIEKATEVYDSFVRRIEGQPDDLFLHWLAKENNITLSEARDLWNRTILPKITPATAHFTKTRIANVPWYERDFETGILDYFYDTGRSIENARHFGPTQNKISPILEKMAREGGNVELAQKWLATITNPGSDLAARGPKEWQKKVMALQSMTKLNPLTTAVNYSQSLAVALRTSVSATLKGLRDMDKEFAMKAGAIINQTLRDIMVVHGGGGAWSSNYMRAIGFKSSETFLRTLAANAGKYHLFDMLELLNRNKRVSFARSQIASFGLDPDKIALRGHFTEEELLLAAKRLSDGTQFRGDVFDVPLLWASGYGRLLTQFKTFSYNQAHLLYRHAIKPAARWIRTGGKEGDIRPAVFFATVYPVFGAAYDVLINQILLGQDPPEDKLQWWLRGITTVGGLGIISSMLDSMAYGEEAILKHLGGPTVTDGVMAANQGYRLLTGQSTNIESELARRTPFVGRILRNRYFSKQRGRPKRGKRSGGRERREKR